tara:strand:+ start:258 stop:968 length:711 start_codon:yes stop_codon:yes gene_type:complete
MRKQLKRLTGKEFFGDVKKYIRSSHDFYKEKNPEIKTLAKRLHDEYVLNDFYKVFNRLWKSGYHNERVMAVYALRMYAEKFDKETWRFLIPRLKEIKDFDEAERIGRIIGHIVIKYPSLKKEIFKMASRRNVYYRRIALSVCFPLVKEKNWEFIFGLIKDRLDDKEENIQELNGWILEEISKKNKTLVRRFVLNNIKMPKVTFDIVSKNFKDLKRVRKLKKLDDRVVGVGWLKVIR